MITCLTLGDNGRLGNQLFQIAAVVGHANRFSTDWRLPQWGFARFFKNLKYEAFSGGCKRVREHHLDFEFLQPDPDYASDLYGYFQSEKYFKHCENKIRHLFEWEENLFVHVPNPALGTISMHVRRGDYVGNDCYVQLDQSYYKDAIAFLRLSGHDGQVMIFSDDIEWCKKQFFGNEYIFSTGRPEIEDLYLMSKCDVHIIANSSFSWWGAWLAQSKSVIAPGTWFAGELTKHSTEKDLLPDAWNKSPLKINEIDLSDLTFTIPVMYDHQDRYENLNLCLSYLRRHFKVNIIVAEQGNERRFAQLCKSHGVQYLFYKSDKQEFERTRLLNDMAKIARTEVIANWDCDVFIDRTQIQDCYLQLKNESADMCYPYDGLFHRMPRKMKRSFEAVLDVSIFSAAGKRSVEFNQVSYGGAVFFRRDSFFKGGMENQYMVSYGPEDYERFERFTKLGYRVTRIKGPLFHLDHFCGSNSSDRNPYFEHNNSVYHAVQQANTKELAGMVSSWPWVEDPDRYNEKFFDQINQDSARAAKGLLPPIIRGGASSILDVGCGEGAWLKESGLTDVMGVDGDWIKPHRLLIPQEKFQHADIGQPLDIGRSFDLVICMEVAEHLPEGQADQLILNLVTHGPAVLFSAAIPGQGGNGHINEQWQSYWVEKFAMHGYYPHSTFRDFTGLPYYYTQNGILFTKLDHPPFGFHPSEFDFVSVTKYKQLLELV